MKNFIVISFLVFLSLNLIAQNTKIDTSLLQVWSGVTWENSSRIIYTYDINCRLETSLAQEWNDTISSWINSSLLTYTYSEDFIGAQLYQTWQKDASTWENATQTTYTYTASHKIASLLSETWVVNQWTPYASITYSYDANNNLDSVISKNTFFGPLQNSNLDVYKSNVDGTTDSLFYNIWNGLTNTWTLISRIGFTYYGDKKVQQDVTENRDTLTNNWSNSYRDNYTYTTSGKLLTALTEFAQGNIWNNTTLTTYTYNANDSLINVLNQFWLNSSWRNSNQLNYAYNNDGTLYQMISQSWNDTNNTWLNIYSNTYSYTTSCTLPLHLISFTASKNKNIVTLNWQTAEEINTSHFNIQRSTDGANFSNVGNVTAKGTGGQSYGFADNIDNLKADKVYYRLQLMDKDGKYSFSKIIPLALDLFARNIKTYPNPVKDQLYILLNAQNAGKATICISDASGKVIHSETVSTTATAMNVNVSRLAKGIYYVQLITDKGVQRTTFMKQ
jgi:hypothetical protein